MCGIAGVVGYRGSDAESLIQRMTDSLAHRGPDASGYYMEDGILLGHRRLSILDLSDRGNQPMQDAGAQFIIVYNGEIYNFQDLRDELKEYAFRTGTDTEVILAAYKTWGERCLDRFNGMFSFAIWDRREQTLFVARDRLGIKPLYFSVPDDGLFVFASELRTLLRCRLFDARIDRQGLAEYLMYQTVHSPRTIVEGVRMLPPGHCGTFVGGKLKLARYWDLVKPGEPVDGDYGEIKKGVRQRLLRSVERRMIADVPLGAFLSGGIDSSAVVGLMAEISDRPVKTFSVGFCEKKYDESHWSSMVARRFKTEHNPILLRSTDFLDIVPKFLDDLDHPTGDGINAYVVSKVTRAKGITVALSGQGGDELFAGYPVFTQLRTAARQAWFWMLSGSLRKFIANGAGLVIGGHRGNKLKQLLSAATPDVQQLYPVFRLVFGRMDVQRMTKDPTIPYWPVGDWLKQEKDGLDALDNLSRISAAEIRNYAQALLLRDGDQVSMAHALEVRVPFFDHELVEYVLRVPDCYKSPVFPKKLLVEALQGLLPDEVAHRPKMGFLFPWAQWLRRELKLFCAAKIAALAGRGLFAPDRLRQVWDRFQARKKGVLWLHIWLLVVLEAWMERNGVEA